MFDESLYYNELDFKLLCIWANVYEAVCSNESNFPVLIRRVVCLMNYFTKMNQTLHSYTLFERMFVERFAQMNQIFQCCSTCERKLYEMCQFNIMNQSFHKWETMFMEVIHLNQWMFEKDHFIRMNQTEFHCCIWESIYESVHSHESNFPILHVREEYLRLISLLE